MKILVTGGAGFIGSNLIDYLLKKRNRVWAIDNLSNGFIDNVRHNLNNSNFRFINDSILNTNVLQKIIKKVDIIFHLAAIVGVKNVVSDPIKCILTNIIGTYNVLNIASKEGRPKIILASSSEVYGRNPIIPYKEECERLLGPTIIKRWIYSETKAIDEYLTLAYFSKFNLPIVTLRFFNCYGPRLNKSGYSSVITKFISQAIKNNPLTVHGNGRQTRCFTYIDDIINALILAGQNKKAIGKIFNVGSEGEITIYNLARLIKKETCSSSQIIYTPHSTDYGKNFEDTIRRKPNLAKIKKTLNWKYTVPLEEGLKKTVVWFRNSSVQKESNYVLPSTKNTYIGSSC